MGASFHRNEGLDRSLDEVKNSDGSTLFPAALPSRNPSRSVRAQTVTASPRAFLESLFRTAVGAAHPANCLPALLPAPPAAGRLLILAAGKAGASMAEVAERHYLDEGGVPASRVSGIAVTRRGYACPTCRARVIEAGHPVPDADGLSGTL